MGSGRFILAWTKIRLKCGKQYGNRRSVCLEGKTVMRLGFLSVFLLFFGCCSNTGPEQPTLPVAIGIVLIRTYETIKQGIDSQRKMLAMQYVSGDFLSADSCVDLKDFWIKSIGSDLYTAWAHTPLGF